VEVDCVALQPFFRKLYESLLNYEGERPYREVLMPELDEARRTLAELKSCSEIQARLLPTENIIEQLWELYAFSRVSDVLLLPFQESDGDDNSWPGPRLTAVERESYFISLGLRPIEKKTFHPFFHEIVKVEQSPDAAEPISLDKVLWSGFMFGSLLACRAGVRVRGGRNYINKEIAETSTMYFTFRRNNRPVDDLSHGWGSNSQWRTKFRRDYVDESNLYYNVDAGIAANRHPIEDFPDSSDRELSAEEKIELLINRCFIVSETPHGGLWPYDDTFSEKQDQQ
jgi:hypothetical protein